ncbi:MAG: hypothetical protein ABW168_09110 [Sedimenticola sp.]
MTWVKVLCQKRVENAAMRLKQRYLTLIFPLLLIGCAPHPGSGEWLSNTPNDQFTRLVVSFDGWAQLHAKGGDEAAQRCFWSGVERNEIQLKCTVADNTDVELNYRFRVTASGLGELMHSNKTIGSFDKQPE